MSFACQPGRHERWETGFDRPGGTTKATATAARHRDVGRHQSAVRLNLERGRLDSLAQIRKIAAALGVTISLVADRRGGDYDRLVDARHAALVEVAAELLRSSGWTVSPEFSFNEFGERGSVDVLAWQTAFEALLVVELKTDIRDVG